jgi:hypothetical protein
MTRALFTTNTTTPKIKRVPEWKLQAAIVAEFHKKQDAGWLFLLAGDGGGLKLNRSQAGIAKLTGCLEGGEPDLRVYRKPGKCGFIELKAEGGVLRPVQVARIARLEAMGFDVRVIQADDAEAAVRAALGVLRDWGLEPSHTLH